MFSLMMRKNWPTLILAVVLTLLSLSLLFARFWGSHQTPGLAPGHGGDPDGKPAATGPAIDPNGRASSTMDLNSLAFGGPSDPNG